MSNLQEYLKQKKQAIIERNERFSKETNLQADTLSASVTAKGRSGVREIRIRDFQIISDSPYDFAGYNLGPSSPELLLGVLGSCLTHITLIQAAALDIPLDSLSVDVTGDLHPLAGKEGYEDIPIYPHNISYTLHIESSASQQKIVELEEIVEKVCPIYNLLKYPQEVKGTVILNKQAVTI